MKSLLVPLFVLAAAPVAVSACEGECIVAITNAFLGNYSVPIQSVLENIANQISAKLIPSHSQASPPLKYLAPLIDAYNKAAYAGLENAIFPSYFHGKCQNADGVDPKGCPNPDCPVVCGTPGSLVHFYAKLKSIAYEETSKMLVTLSSPGSDSYKAVEKAVLADAGGGPGEHTRRYGRAVVPMSRRADSLQDGLRAIMEEIAKLLEEACGGGLAACSWEVAMKEFILSFP